MLIRCAQRIFAKGILEGTGFPFSGGKAPQNSPITQVSASLLVGLLVAFTQRARSDLRRGNSGALSHRKRETPGPSKILLAKIPLVQCIKCANHQRVPRFPERGVDLWGVARLLQGRAQGELLGKSSGEPLALALKIHSEGSSRKVAGELLGKLGESPRSAGSSQKVWGNVTNFPATRHKIVCKDSLQTLLVLRPRWLGRSVKTAKWTKIA